MFAKKSVKIILAFAEKSGIICVVFTKKSVGERCSGQHGRQNYGTTAELDFLLQAGERIVPVEVKAGANPKAKSLWTFVDSHPGLHGIRFSLLPRREQEWVLNVPLYGVSAWLAGADEANN